MGVRVRLCCVTSMWHPNQRQWWIISVAAILGVLGALFMGRYGSFFVTIAVFIGALLIWQVEADRKR